MRGTPTLYQGDELATEDGVIPDDKLHDPPAKRLGPKFGRDPCRTPMQWDATPNAGFSSVEPWLPVSADYRERNVAAAANDPTSIFNLYRRLIAVRRATDALFGGSYCSVPVSDDVCFAYLREADGARFLIALNFSAEPRNLDLSSAAGSGVVVVSTWLDREGAIDLASVTLRGDEGILVRL